MSGYVRCKQILRTGVVVVTRCQYIVYHVGGGGGGCAHYSGHLANSCCFPEQRCRLLRRTSGCSRGRSRQGRVAVASSTVVMVVVVLRRRCCRRQRQVRSIRFVTTSTVMMVMAVAAIDVAATAATRLLRLLMMVMASLMMMMMMMTRCRQTASPCNTAIVIVQRLCRRPSLPTTRGRGRSGGSGGCWRIRR